MVLCHPFPERAVLLLLNFLNMIFRSLIIPMLGVLLFAGCQSKKGLLYTVLPTAADTLKFPQEKHLKNVRQLTFGGDNAEAYWSFDDKKIVFQATIKIWGAECDQIYYFDLG